MYEKQINNVMKLDDATKKLLQAFVRQEVNQLFMLHKEKFFQMLLCKPDVAINNDKKAYNNLVKICNKKPKNFSSKKEYMEWVEQVV